MRRSTLLILLMSCTCLPAAADEGGFAGVWTAWICPSGAQSSSGKCANFVLELLQKENRICGTHLFATADAARLDQGAAPSIIGEIADGKATVLAVSGLGSPPVRVHVELKMADGALQWKRIENPKGDYLLPATAQLTRSKRKTLLKPMFENELKAACEIAYTAAAARAAPQPVPVPR